MARPQRGANPSPVVILTVPRPSQERYRAIRFPRTQWPDDRGTGASQGCEKNPGFAPQGALLTDVMGVCMWVWRGGSMMRA